MLVLIETSIKAMKSYSFPRPLTGLELWRLSSEYDAHWNCDDGHKAVLAGGDDPEALRLSPGQVYSTLEYDTVTDAYYWTHTNHYRPDDESETQYDLTDAYCDKFHARYELI